MPIMNYYMYNVFVLIGDKLKYWVNPHSKDMSVFFFKFDSPDDPYLSWKHPLCQARIMNISIYCLFKGRTPPDIENNVHVVKIAGNSGYRNALKFQSEIHQI